jgi:MarR family transcriptional regulator, organic hydroperoxide resistance regulator
MTSKSPYRPPLTTSLEPLITQGSDDDFREVVDSLVAFAGQLQQIREALSRQMHLTPPQYNILMTLAHIRKGDVTASALAERLRVTLSFVVTETRRLDEMGLLIKEVDENDRRRVHLKLTEKGIAALASIAPVQRQVNDILFASLDRKRFEMLGKIASGLLASCENGLNAARAPKPPAPKRR